MDVRDDGEPHAGIVGDAALVWLVAAALLWRTAVPDLSLPNVDASTVFPAEYLGASDRYARFNRVNWVLATSSSPCSWSASG